MLVHQHIVCLEVSVSAPVRCLKVPSKMCSLSGEVAKGLGVVTTNLGSTMLPTRGHLAPHTAGVSALKVPAKVSDGLTFRNEFEDQHLANISSLVFAQEGLLRKKHLWILQEAWALAAEPLRLQHFAEVPPSTAMRPNALGQLPTQLDHEDMVEATTMEFLCAISRGAAKNGRDTVQAEDFSQSSF